MEDNKSSRDERKYDDEQADSIVEKDTGRRVGNHYEFEGIRNFSVENDTELLFSRDMYVTEYGSFQLKREVSIYL
jgi:hypothetical protein